MTDVDCHLKLVKIKSLNSDTYISLQEVVFDKCMF